MVRALQKLDSYQGVFSEVGGGEGMTDKRFSCYITHRIDEESLRKSPLKCEDCGKDPTHAWQYRIDYFAMHQTTWWLCKKCIKKRFKKYLKEEKG